jgi:hypothetical protein
MELFAATPPALPISIEDPGLEILNRFQGSLCFASCRKKSGHAPSFNCAVIENVSGGFTIVAALLNFSHMYLGHFLLSLSAFSPVTQIVIRLY